MIHNVICAKNTLWLWSSLIFMMTQNAQKRCCWHCNIWPNYFFFSPITFLFIWRWQWHIRVYEEMFDVNGKIAQTMQNIWNFIVGKLILLKKWQTRAIMREIRSTKSCGLYERVGSTAHYYLVYKLKTNLFVSLTHCEREGNNSNWWRKLMRRSQRYKQCWENRSKDKHIITWPAPHTQSVCVTD